MESGAISDAQISASTQRDRNHAAILGRLHLQEKTGIWAPAIRDANQWLQIDFISQDMRVTRVATQGRPSAYYLHWVTSYKLQYGSGGVAFMYYRDYGKSACEDKVKSCSFRSH